jgi:DNA-binding MarR family transcriptional regulator
MYRSSTSLAGPILLCDPAQIGFAAEAAEADGNSAEGAARATAPGPSDATNGQLARSIINARSARAKYLDAELFADPAWDMLLELYALTCEGRRVSVSKLSLAAGVPTTTALRWIDKLEAECLVVRVDDPVDARRVWIMLSRAGYSAMETFVDQIMGHGIGL